MDSENCFWTVDDVSHYLKVSNDTIYHWIEKMAFNDDENCFAT